MGRRRYLKFVSVFRYTGRYFFKSVLYLLSVFKIVRYQFGIFGILLCIKAPPVDTKILLPSQSVDCDRRSVTA